MVEKVNFLEAVNHMRTGGFAKFIHNTDLKGESPEPIYLISDFSISQEQAHKIMSFFEIKELSLDMDILECYVDSSQVVIKPALILNEMREFPNWQLI